MEIKSKPFTQIDREYKINSAELRKALNLEGEILNMGLWAGRSLKEKEAGKSPECDVWIIITSEKKIKEIKKED